MTYNYNLITLDLNNNIKNFTLSDCTNLSDKHAELSSDSTLEVINKTIVDFFSEFSKKTIINKLVDYITVNNISLLSDYTQEVFAKMYNKEQIIMMDYINSFIYLFNITDYKVQFDNYEINMNSKQMKEFEDNNFIRIPITDFDILKSGFTDLMLLYGEDYELPNKMKFMSYNGDVSGFVIKDKEVYVDGVKETKINQLEDDDIIFIINGSKIYNDILFKIFSK